jgi:hypothetical protein
MPFNGRQAAIDTATWFSGIPIVGGIVSNLYLAAALVTVAALVIVMATYWYKPARTGSWATRLKTAIYTFLLVLGTMFIHHQGTVARFSHEVRGGRDMRVFEGAMNAQATPSRDVRSLIVGGELADVRPERAVAGGSGSRHAAGSGSHHAGGSGSRHGGGYDSDSSSDDSASTGSDESDDSDRAGPEIAAPSARAVTQPLVGAAQPRAVPAAVHVVPVAGPPPVYVAPPPAVAPTVVLAVPGGGAPAFATGGGDWRHTLSFPPPAVRQVQV